MLFPTAPSDSLLARLRATTRVAMLVLLVFALKIGSSAASIQHDLADAGQAPGEGHGLVVKAVDSKAGDESAGEADGLGACSDCGCQDGSAVIQTTNAGSVVADTGLAAHAPALAANAMPRLELRPPIV